MKVLKTIGSTSQILEVFINDSSSTVGAGLPGLTNASSGLTGYYHRSGDVAGGTSISIVSMTVGTFTSGGFKEIDATNMPGWYQLCPPNAVFAAGRSASICLKGVTNMAQLNIEVQLTAVDVDDGTRFGMLALPNATAGATGGLGPFVIRGGTAQAGSTTTITLDAGASAVDDFYTGDGVVVTGSTGAGQSKVITSYVGSTKVATVGSNFATSPGNTSTFDLYPFGVQGATNYATTADVATIITEIDNTSSSTQALIGTYLPVTITKNAALAGFMFPMYLSSDHVSPATGKTVTATRSLDRSAFTAMTNSVVEISNGWYYIDLAATDTNGNTFAFNFAATACDTTKFSGATQP